MEIIVNEFLFYVKYFFIMFFLIGSSFESYSKKDGFLVFLGVIIFVIWNVLGLLMGVEVVF